MLTIVLALALIIALGFAVGMVLRCRDVEREKEGLAVEKAAAEFEVARLTQHAEDLLVPLTWTWDHVEADPVEGFGPRLRAYLVACYLEIQKMVLKDDVEMTEAMAEARSAQAPRRLPTRPQVPPFLARPEDVVGALQSPSLPYERPKVTALPTHDFDVVTTRVQGAEAHHGASLPWGDRPDHVAFGPTGKPRMERYFLPQGPDGWHEISVEAFGDLFVKNDHRDVYIVAADATPETEGIPEEIRAIVWAPARETTPEPVALDDEG